MKLSGSTQLVIFTDLDGTLLDDKYSFAAALPALRLIKNRKIPLVICSSKTRTEIEYYRKKFQNKDPFVSENGGGIFIPKGYFGHTVYRTDLSLETGDDYTVLRLGAQYPELRRTILDLQATGLGVRGFGDMTPDEIVSLTGLRREEAAMSKEREFDEPFVLERSNDELRVFQEIEARGFRLTKGRFYHILGNSDKGKAVSILSGLYRSQYDAIVTVGIGDSPNDIPMLEAVDIPVLVQKADGTYDPGIDRPEIAKARGIGPKGWNAFVLYQMKAAGYLLPPGRHA